MHYETLVETYEKLSATTKRLNKTYYIVEILKNTSEKELSKITLLLQGKIFPSHDERKIGVASRLVLKALNIATGIDAGKIESIWKKTGDLGDTAEDLVKKKTQRTLFTSRLTVEKVFSNIQSLAVIEGEGSVDKKLKLIAELLTSALPVEAKYITRTILEDLRVGVGDGSMRDAIAWAFFPPVYGIFFKCERCKKIMPKVQRCLYCTNEISQKFAPEPKNFTEIEKLPEKEFIYAETESEAREIYNQILNTVQYSYDLTNDFGITAITAKTKGIKGLREIALSPLTPIKVMLYQKAGGFEDAFERVGKPAAIEYKYDGFRVQCHKKNNKVQLFTRRLEDVTGQFPEVAERINSNVNAKNFIIDSEVIGIDPKTKKFLPFQKISRRIKRKYDIGFMRDELPVAVKIFDIMEAEGKNFLNEPFRERRAMLKKIVKEEKDKITLAEQKIVSTIKEAEKFYKESLEMGNEGAMMKNLEAPYKPGSRVGYGVKIKPSMEPLDLVIIGAEWGEGKRSSWLSSFTIACRDDEGKFLEMGKVGTGIKEKEEEGASFEELTKLLEPLIISEKGRAVKVKPKIVLEIEYEEIQKSPSYTSGFALRFPRLKNIRDDKPVSEIHTIEEVEAVYNSQFDLKQ
jgi:ATP-dependent DNA ligase I